MIYKTAFFSAWLLLLLHLFPVLSDAQTNRFPIIEKGKIGFIDKTGAVKIKPAFSDAHRFSGTRTSAAVGSKWGIIDSAGNWILEPVYEIIGPIAEGRASYLHNGRYGYLDEQGNIIVEAQYDEAQDFDNEVAWVKKKGHYLLLSKSGQPVTETEYVEITPFKEGLAAVRTEKFFGYIDNTGKTVIPFKYFSALPFSEGKAFVYESKLQWHVIDLRGKTLFNITENRNIRSFSNGLAVFEGVFKQTSVIEHTTFTKLNQAAALSANGKVVFKPFYDQLIPCAPDRVWAQEETGEWYLLNHAGKKITQQAFENVAKFKNGLAPVKLNGFLSYIDLNGKLLFEPYFDKAFPFEEGLAQVEKFGKTGYVNTDGEFVYFFQDFEDSPIAQFPAGGAALNQYIREKLEVPATMDSAMLGRSVFVSADVSKNGKINNPKVLKGLRADLDQAALALVQDMPHWVPALKNQQSFASSIVIPVRFNDMPRELITNPDLLEVKPQFPGGQNAFLKFIARERQYPKEAKLAGAEGTVYVQFEVTKEGGLANCKVLKGVDPYLDAEALRVVKAMPAWEPGKIHGKPVATKLILPLGFRLTTDEIPWHAKGTVIFKR